MYSLLYVISYFFLDTSEFVPYDRGQIFDGKQGHNSRLPSAAVGLFIASTNSSHCTTNAIPMKPKIINCND